MSKLHDATNTILRAEWFRTSLTHPDSHVPRESIAEIVSLWNEAIGAADASHTGYMAKVQPNGKTPEELLWSQASRLSLGLARMRCIPIAEVDKEERQALLLIQRMLQGFEIGPDWRGDDAVAKTST